MFIKTTPSILAVTFPRPYTNKRRKRLHCVDSAVMFEAGVPDQNKCTLCSTVEQDHSQDKSDGGLYCWKWLL